MDLVHSWKESLSIFSPSTIKLYVLVTIKSLLQAYRLLFQYCWWLGAIIIGGDLVMFYLKKPLYITEENVSLPLLGYSFGMGFVLLLLLYAAFLFIRSSARQKNKEYIFAYSGRYFLIFAIASFIIGVVPVFLAIFTFFLLDTDFSLHELWPIIRRTFYMMFYNLPFYVITELLMVILRLLVVMYTGAGYAAYFFFVQRLIIFLVLLMPAIAWLHTFYVKRVHEQGELYY